MEYSFNLYMLIIQCITSHQKCSRTNNLKLKSNTLNANVYSIRIHSNLFYRGVMFYLHVCDFWFIAYTGVQYEFNLKLCSCRLRDSNTTGATSEAGHVDPPKSHV